MSKNDGLLPGTNSNSKGVHHNVELEKKLPSDIRNGQQVNNETTAGQNLITAGSRIGDELSDENKSVSPGPNTSNVAPMASTKFGEELVGRERSNYEEDITAITTTDDLTDDNDALTERADKIAYRTSESSDGEKSVWDKVKDKAAEFGDGIKSAFD